MKDVFIDDLELRDIKEWVTKYIKEGMDWKNNFMHRRIYNHINFTLGILRKVELARSTITITSAKELIKLLYILGYGEKQTTYLLYTWGYNSFTINQVASYIKSNYWRWNKEKEELMKQLEEAKNKIFQQMTDELMASERRTIEILLQKKDRLNEKLEQLDPIDNKDEFNICMRQIERIEKKINEAHGVNDLRKSLVKMNEELVIHKGKKSIDDGTDNNERLIDTSSPAMIE